MTVVKINKSWELVASMRLWLLSIIWLTLNLAAAHIHADPGTGKKLAIVVGVNQYHHTKLEKLRYAENDATDLASTLKSAGFEVSLLITGDAPTKSGTPTKVEIEKRITEILSGRKREDMVLITLAGHGLQFDGDEEAFFCPVDAVPLNDAQNRKTLLPLNQLYKKLDESGAGVKLLLVDACRDDPTAGRGASRGVDGSSAPRLPKGTAVLFSCSAGERAFEHDNYRHGVFFHHVLEGLRGKAKNEDGEVTWDRLVDYVKRRVSREVPKLIKGGAQQSPVHFTGGIGGEPPVLVPPGAGQNRRGNLDLFVGSIDKAAARKHNLQLKTQAIVILVVPGGGGDRMGVHSDDVIVEVNGREIANYSEYFAALEDVSVGAAVTLNVLREGKPLVLSGKFETNYPEEEMFRKVRDLAGTGDPAAEESLAWMFANGIGTSENEKEALRFYRRSAEKGHAYSQFAMGEFFENGRGTTKDLKEAFKWYRQAADHGLADARNAVGLFYSDGRGIPVDHHESIKWFQLSSDQGFHWAQHNLADSYRKGQGVAKDIKKAIELFRKSADQKNTSAMVALADIFADGEGVTKDDQEAFRYYKKAADLNDAAAQNRVGLFYDSGRFVAKDAKEAVKWFQKAAAQNFDWGQFNLASKYEQGDGIAEDQSLAFRWYKKAADQGLSDAQNQIGLCYFSGSGVDKNLEESAKWFRKSAEQGNAEGQNNLGNVFYSGNGVEKNHAEAAKWYAKAAEQGLASGEYNLGICYRDGAGVKKDLKEARKWLKKAADQGHEDAKKDLADLDKK